MGSVFGRAMVAAGAVVVLVLGSAVGAAAKPGPPVLAFSPAPFDYGQVAAGQAALHTFTLANTGGRGTGRLRVRLAGAAAFTITGDSCRRLRPGNTCTVTVQFAPTSTGTVTATLIAASKHKKRARTTDALTGSEGLGAAPGNIYWADDGKVNAAGLDGSNPQTLATGDNPIGVAVDSSHLYWASSFGNTINEAGLDGSNPQTLVSGQGAAGLAVDGSHIYWSIEFSGPTTLGTIWAAGLDGSNPHMIVTGQSDPYGVAVYGGHVYWASAGTGVAGAGSIWEAGLDGSNPHAIVTGQNDPLGVAAVGSQLYWTDSAGNVAGAGSVWEAGLDGSSPRAIVTGQNGPLGVAADGSHLYWADVLDQAIEQANPDGSSPHAIVTGLGDPRLMAVTPPPAALAFTPSPFDYGQVGTGQTASPQTFTLANTGGQATGTLTATLTGSAAFTVTGDTCTGISLAAGGTCTVTVRFAPASIATDTATLTAASANPAVTATDALTGTGVRPRFLYWTDQMGGESGTINAIPLTGAGAPTTLVTGQPSPAGVAVDASHIYWATAATRVTTAAIEEAPLTGGHPTALVHTGLESPAGVAVDASHIYWADFGSGTVSERPLTGGITITLYSSRLAAPTGVAVDSGHVYWANSGNGTINETPLTGGPVTTLVREQLSPVGVAVSP
jgi:hypothetical protein